MTSFSIFTQPTSAMRANTLSFNVIGDNIANAVTPGFKAADTRFREQVIADGGGSTPSLSGIKPNIQHFIDKQGIIEATNRTLDIAIDGNGFFVTNSASDVRGEFQLTRAGQFDLTVVDPGPTEKTFITDGSGNFVLGWPADGLGGFIAGDGLNSLGPMQVDPSAHTLAATATTIADLDAVLPSDSAVGFSTSTGIGVFDEAGNENLMKLTFTKTAINTWDLDIEVENSNLTTGVFPTTAVTFTSAGVLTSASTVTVAPTYTLPGGGAGSIALDIAGLNEFAGTFTVISSSRDGSIVGQLQSLSVDNNGVIAGNFSNGGSQGLYKLPIATVTSPNLLLPRANTHYAISSAAGELKLLEGNLTDQAQFIPSALEASTTSLDGEFTKMIQMQQSYTSNVRAYTVAEEMIRTATDLKQ